MTNQTRGEKLEVYLKSGSRGFYFFVNRYLRHTQSFTVHQDVPNETSPWQLGDNYQKKKVAAGEATAFFFLMFLISEVI